MQDLDDGAYHEDEEEAGKQVLSMQDIVAVEWSTSHSLHLGSNDYSPALVIHALKPTPGEGCQQAVQLVCSKGSLSPVCAEPCFYLVAAVIANQDCLAKGNCPTGVAYYVLSLAMASPDILLS